jgi:hypothetical protein
MIGGANLTARVATLRLEAGLLGLAMRLGSSLRSVRMYSHGQGGCSLYICGSYRGIARDVYM